MMIMMTMMQAFDNIDLSSIVRLGTSATNTHWYNTMIPSKQRLTMTECSEKQDIMVIIDYPKQTPLW
jgi:hypothetical protein